VWEEPRGLAAGYTVPQFSIHRARLHSVLYKAALNRLPRGSVHLGNSVTSFCETGNRLATTPNVSKPSLDASRDRDRDKVSGQNVFAGRRRAERQ